MDYSNYEQLKVENNDGIATVTFNRPEAMNTMSGGLHKEIEDVFVDVSNDEHVNTVIVTGAGRAFSAGGDIKLALSQYETDDGWKKIIDGYQHARRLVENILNCPKPTIAAINGDAMGAGATIALLCDIQVMADTARIGDTHVKVGLVTGDGAALILPLLLGPNRAKEFLMCSRVIRGEEAQKLNLVNYSVPAAEVMSKALEIATVLRKQPPLAVKFTKIAVNKMIKDQYNLIMDASYAFEMVTKLSKDRGEALRAFAEKRKPNPYIGL